MKGGRDRDVLCWFLNFGGQPELSQKKERKGWARGEKGKGENGSLVVDASKGAEEDFWTPSGGGPKNVWNFQPLEKKEGRIVVASRGGFIIITSLQGRQREKKIHSTPREKKKGRHHILKVKTLKSNNHFQLSKSILQSTAHLHLTRGKKKKKVPTITRKEKKKKRAGAEQLQ